MGVEAFNDMYFDRCLWVTERIGDLDFFMEYECCIQMKELHSYNDKVEISEFIVLAIFLCKIWEWLMGNQLKDARRQNKGMVLSSPSYFVCNIFTKALYSLLRNNDSGWSLVLQLYSYCSAVYARLRKVYNKQKVFLLTDMAHISGLVASWVMCSPFVYAIVVTCATQFMGDWWLLQELYKISRCIHQPRLTCERFFANIAHFLLATIGGERATNIVLDSNLEDKVLIEGGSIVMNLTQPNVDTYMNVTQLVIGPRRSNKNWKAFAKDDLGPMSN